MRNVKQIYVLLIMIIFTFLDPQLYCQRNNSKGFIITGYIEGIEDSTKVVISDDQQIDIDTAYSKNGNFKLKGYVKYPTLCSIRCKNEYASIMVENVPITFDAKLKNMFLNSKIKGGKEQDLNNELNELQLPFANCYYRTKDSLNNIPDLNSTERDRLRKEQYESAKNAMQILREFAIKHANSYLGLEYLYKTRDEIEKAQLKPIYEDLDSLMRSTPNAKALQIYLYNETVEKGKPFIDFEAQTLDGKLFRLSSLKGNYIFLSFWSAGCGPCRRENKKIKENYDRLQKQMIIVSFSIDTNKVIWQHASKVDSIIWCNVSDLEGEIGKVKTLYGVQAIPTSFVIDKEGIIIERYDGYSDRILYHLEALINKNEH